MIEKFEEQGNEISATQKTVCSSLNVLAGLLEKSVKKKKKKRKTKKKRKEIITTSEEEEESSSSSSSYDSREY